MDCVRTACTHALQARCCVHAASWRGRQGMDLHRSSSLDVCSPPASREATGNGSDRARGEHGISRSCGSAGIRFECRSVTVVEVGAQPLGLEEVEPRAEVREECRGWVVIVAVLASGRVAPVHVQRPHVEGQLPRRPARDVILGLDLCVLVPPCEPRAVSPIGQQRRRAGERHEGAPRRLPARERAAQQEDVRVARHVVGEVVAVGVGVRGAGGRGCSAAPSSEQRSGDGPPGRRLRRRVATASGVSWPCSRPICPNRARPCRSRRAAQTRAPWRRHRARGAAARCTPRW